MALVKVTDGANETESNKLIFPILLVSAFARADQSARMEEDRNSVKAPASLMDMQMPPVVPNFLCGQEDVYSSLTAGAVERQLGEKMEAVVQFGSLSPC